MVKIIESLINNLHVRFPDLEFLENFDLLDFGTIKTLLENKSFD